MPGGSPILNVESKGKGREKERFQDLAGETSRLRREKVPVVVARNSGTDDTKELEEACKGCLRSAYLGVRYAQLSES